MSAVWFRDPSCGVCSVSGGPVSGWRIRNLTESDRVLKWERPGFVSGTTPTCLSVSYMQSRKTTSGERPDLQKLCPIT